MAPTGTRKLRKEAPKYVEQTEKRLKSQQETDRTGRRSVIALESTPLA